MTSKKVWSLALVAAMILSLLAGCGQTPNSSENNGQGNDNLDAPPTTGEEVVDTSRDTLIFVADRETATLDNQAFAVGEYAQREIYEGLLRVEADGSIAPCLALEWEQIDELTWKFYLRDDVTFHNGEPFTSADVIYTLNRTVEDPQVASVINFLDLENCVADDEYTVTICTKEPYALFEQMMCHLYLRIVNEKAVEDAGSAENYGRNPVGTGPYKFVSWTSGSQIVLVRNEEYWGEKAKIENLIIRFITETTSRAIALEAGDADIIDAVATEDWTRIRDGEETYLVAYEQAGARYIAINCERGPLQDQNVRLALRYATNVPELVNVVWGEDTYEAAAGTMVPPSLPGHDGNLPAYEYDVERAKELLAEAGYADGIELTAVYNGNTAANNTFFQLLQEYWRGAGINLILNPTDSANLNTALNEGTYDISLCNAVADIAEVGYMLGFWYDSDRCGSGNRSWLRDETVDAMLDELDMAFDADERASIAVEIQERIYDLANVIVLQYPYKNFGCRSNVRGLVATTAMYPRLSEVYFVEE